jgi:hypothetical protein
MNGIITRTTIALGLLTAAISAASCGDTSQGKSPSILQIDTLVAASGADPGKSNGTLASDVVTLVTQTVGTESVKVPTIYEDIATAGLKFIIKDMGNPGGEASPTKNNNIVVNRYRVVYKRADGRNVQGVDVPYAFDGAVTATIDDSGKIVSFALVRIQAKQEQPLKALAGGGGRVAIATIADVTFFGHDMAGNPVQQTGSISINFADWGDPE